MANARHQKINLPGEDGRVGIMFDNWPEADRTLWPRIEGKTEKRGLAAYLAETQNGQTTMRQTQIGNRYQNAGRAMPKPSRQPPPRKAKAFSADRLKQHQSTYGIWLAFLKYRDPELLAAAPVERICEPLVSGFHELVAATCSPDTVRTYLARLYNIALRFSPQTDWQWLRDYVKDAKPSNEIDPEDYQRLRPPYEVAELGHKLMAKADELFAGSNLRGHRRWAAVKFRNGLMLVMFVDFVIRRRSMLSLTVQDFAPLGQETSAITFGADRMKARRAETIPVSEYVHRQTQRYIQSYRPILLGSRDSNSLWIGEQGTDLGETGMYDAICRETKAGLQVKINPHFIRKCVATWQATERPDMIADLPSLLQHQGPEVTDKYYVLSQTLEASRKMSAILTADRAAARRQASLIGQGG